MSTVVREGMIEQSFATAAQLAALRSLFVGVSFDFSFLPVDPWWLPEFGQTLSIAEYPLLFSKIGTTYGGDGVTTFKLRDKRGRVSVGVDNMGGTAANRITVAGAGIDGKILGVAGGAQTVALSLAQMPAHGHNITVEPAPDHQHGLDLFTGSAGGSLAWQRVSSTVPTADALTDPAGAHAHSASASETGGGEAHNNIQPMITSYSCILAY